MNGTHYVVSTLNTNNKEITWSHNAYNLNSPTTDTVQYSATRTKYFTGTLSGSVEVNALLNTVDVAAEVSYGTNTSTTTSVTYSIPGYSAYRCRFGSVCCVTTGRMEDWFYGTLTSSRYVYANFTRHSFSDKVNLQ